MPTKRLNVELLCSLVGFRHKCGHQGSQPRYCQGEIAEAQTRPDRGAERRVLRLVIGCVIRSTPYSLCFNPSPLPTLQHNLQMHDKSLTMLANLEYRHVQF